MPPAITVSNVWKQYGLPVPFFGRRRPWSLQDVSFTVERGETLGVIGRNGAGKSTLLKVLAGVTPPTKGHANVTGRVFPMIELNAGLHGELTGRENAYLLGAVMGLLRRDVDGRMSAIEAYCELGEWFDRPVRQYSSGMLARIGFAVAVNVDADILLVDEVLAVGDMAFQRRCYDRIAEMKEKGVTILLVSHNIRQIERLCERAILLDKGRMVFTAAAGLVADRYFGEVLQSEEDALVGAAVSEAHVQKVKEVSLMDVSFLNGDGEKVGSVRSGDDVLVRLRLCFDVRVESPLVAVGFVTSDMIMVGAVGNEFHESRAAVEGVAVYTCRIRSLPLLPGVYALRVKVRDARSAMLLAGDNLAVLRVDANDRMRFGLDKAGLVALDADWRQDVGT